MAPRPTLGKPADRLRCPRGYSGVPRGLLLSEGFGGYSIVVVVVAVVVRVVVVVVAVVVDALVLLLLLFSH